MQQKIRSADRCCFSRKQLLLCTPHELLLILYSGSEAGPGGPTKDGPKMAPRWPQDGPKMTPRWPQDDPKMAPTWPKMVPIWPNMAPRWFRDGPTWPQDGPTWPQDGAKLAPLTTKILKQTRICPCKCLHVMKRRVCENASFHGCRLLDRVLGPRSLKMAEDGPKMATRLPKMAPSWPQIAPR